ncbi:hypothetical protein MMC21_003571 [Puttea exsequens]|nr:hypothetical protein [Puttea exsequens]
MEPAAEPLIPEAIPPSQDQNPSTKPHSILSRKLPWIPLALLSGFCAAINGVFAKLTTTELTSSWAGAISTAFGLDAGNKFIEFLIRGFFFLLNLAFNAIMWTLFTAALTRASSTTRVSIINTSANFMLTAFSGWIVFGEKLPGLWWVGAAGLVVGNVVIGRREEEGDVTLKGKVGEVSPEESGGEGAGDYRDEVRDGEGHGVGKGGISDGVELVEEHGRGGSVR